MRSSSRIGILGIAFAIGLMGMEFAPSRPGTVHAEVREQTSRSHFQSGAARSEQVLREMLAVLRTIDRRLQTLEKLAAVSSHRRGQGAGAESAPAGRGTNRNSSSRTDGPDPHANRTSNFPRPASPSAPRGSISSGDNSQRESAGGDGSTLLPSVGIKLSRPTFKRVVGQPSPFGPPRR